MNQGFLHVGLGPLGRRLVADFHGRKLGHIVAAVDHDRALVGKDLAELIPEAPRGGRILSHVSEVTDWRRIHCAFVTTSSDLELCMDTFRALLAQGCSVVSTCEELAWPWLRHPLLAAELHELAVRHRARILGTGVNPGFLMDAFPIAASTVCNAVRAVKIWRIQDASKRRVPFQKKIGVGLDETTFQARIQDGSLRHVGLGESLHFLAHHLGWKVERWDETIEPVVSERDLQSGLGPVQKGRARGVRQVARGFVAGHLALELVFQAALEEPESYDRVLLESDPPIDVCFNGGVHGDTATTAIVLNSVRALMSVEPGLHTMASIPLMGCAPAAS